MTYQYKEVKALVVGDMLSYLEYTDEDIADQT